MEIFFVVVRIVSCKTTYINLCRKTQQKAPTQGYVFSKVWLHTMNFPAKQLGPALHVCTMLKTFHEQLRAHCLSTPVPSYNQLHASQTYLHPLPRLEKVAEKKKCSRTKL